MDGFCSMRAVASCANAAMVSARARPRRAPRAIAAAMASSRLVGVCARAASVATSSTVATAKRPNGFGITSPIYVRRDADRLRAYRLDSEPRMLRFAQQPAVDAVAGMRVIEANRLQSGENADGRPHHDVARP